MVLVLLGLFVLVAAIDDFTRGQDDPDQIRVIVAVSFFSFLIFGVLAIYKFRYARILNSASLYKDGVCSLLGTVLALALFINSLIIESRAAAWWLDPTVAIVASLLTLVYGCYGVYHAKVKEGLPIFSCKWWFTSKGEGKSASDSSRPGPEHFRSSPGVELPPTQDEDDEDDVEGVV